MGAAAQKKRIKALAESVKKTDSEFSFHITDREVYALVEHSFAPANNPSNHNDQARVFDMYNKLHMVQTWELLRGQNSKQLGIDDFDAEKYAIAKNVSVDLIDYILALTDKPMQMLHALVLTPFIRRLKDVKMGAYVCPDEPDDEEDEEEEGKAAPADDEGEKH